MPKFNDLAGHVFGRLRALEVSSRVNGIKWLCRCECGATTVVLAGHLRSGRSTSCGCLHREQLGNRTRTHGMSDCFEYRVWNSMRSRCTDQRHPRYANYGGRGIEVCARWSAFSVFIADMGKAPSEKHSIDRIDNDAGYEPLNCRWATRDQQARNTSRTKRVTIGSETLCVKDWAARVGVSERAFAKRVACGWPQSRLLLGSTR